MWGAATAVPPRALVPFHNCICTLVPRASLFREEGRRKILHDSREGGERSGEIGKEGWMNGRSYGRSVSGGGGGGAALSQPCLAACSRSRGALGAHLRLAYGEGRGVALMPLSVPRRVEGTGDGGGVRGEGREISENFTTSGVENAARERDSLTFSIGGGGGGAPRFSITIDRDAHRGYRARGEVEGLVARSR